MKGRITAKDEFVKYVAGFYTSEECGIESPPQDAIALTKEQRDLRDVSNWFDAIVHGARIALGQEEGEA